MPDEYLILNKTKGKKMKYLFIIVLFTSLLIACKGKTEVSAAKTDSPLAKHETHMQADGEKLVYYTCPMESHKHIHSSAPGFCSECNMALVPAVVTSEEKHEFYGCPMEIHSHIRHDAPGRCEECKMELKPMRLARH